MARKRKVKRSKRGAFVKGRIIIHPSGYAFVEPEDKSMKDIFIPPGKTANALPGDKVLVRVQPSRTRKKLLEGVVSRVIERKIKEIIGFYNGAYVVPRDERNLFWYFVPSEHTLSAQPGDLVVARITQYPTRSGQAEAEIIEVLGKELTLELESKLILREYGFREGFPSTIKSELERIPDRVLKHQLKNRENLSDVPFVTIDPPDARDFDDAISVKKNQQGYKLWVAIADVSEYVPCGSEIDVEAYNRATSVYLPNRAIPMLPEPISAGIASLNPERLRLAMVVEIDFDQKARPKATKFYPAVIKSWARLNYLEVEELFAGKEQKGLLEQIVKMLFDAKELAKKLYKKRLRRGAINLDIPEPIVKLNEKGEPVDIYPRQQLFSHILIEEFMLRANQAVAEFLTKKKMVFPYRIHEPPAPDKVEELDFFLSAIGFPLLQGGKKPEQIQPKDFQRLIRRIHNLPISGLISYLVLRTQMQAKYSPNNKGHFGLALSRYCHFTSPIRRYPDLIVHRALKQALGIVDKNLPISPQPMGVSCEHCSERERSAEAVERDVVRAYQVRLMSKHLGEQFSARVSGISEQGIFVELDHPMAEGLIPGRELLGYDYEPHIYTAFIKKPRLEIHLGDKVLVEVESVNLEHREINFKLIGREASVLSISLAGERRQARTKREKKKASRRGRKKRKRK